MSDPERLGRIDLTYVRELVIGFVPKAHEVTLHHDPEYISFSYQDDEGVSWPVSINQPDSQPEALVVFTGQQITDAKPLHVLVAANLWNATTLSHNAVSYIPAPLEAEYEEPPWDVPPVLLGSSVMLHSGALVRIFDTWINGFLESISAWNNTIAMALETSPDEPDYEDDSDPEDHYSEVWPDECNSSLDDSPPFQLHVNFTAGDWPESGVLSQMGYRVGRSGLEQSSRRAILQQVVFAELVADSPDAIEYVEGWGAPGSWQRLQKIVNALTAFARNARRKSGDYSEAIADWESDLEWLQVTFGS